MKLTLKSFLILSLNAMSQGSINKIEKILIGKESCNVIKLILRNFFYDIGIRIYNGLIL